MCQEYLWSEAEDGGGWGMLQVHDETKGGGGGPFADTRFSC